MTAQEMENLWAVELEAGGAFRVRKLGDLMELNNRNMAGLLDKKHILLALAHTFEEATVICREYKRGAGREKDKGEAQSRSYEERL